MASAARRGIIAVSVKSTGLIAGMMVLVRCAQFDNAVFTQFAVCWTAVAISNSIADLGMNLLVFKRASAQELSVRQLFTYLVMVAVASTVFSIPVALFLVRDSLEESVLLTLWACMAACSTVCASALRGFQKIALSSFFEGNQSGACASLLTLVGIQLFLAEAQHFRFVQLLGLIGVAQFFNLVLVALCVLKSTFTYSDRPNAAESMVSSLAASLPLMAARVAGTFLFKSTPLFLWWLWQPAEVAGYLVAQRFIEGILMLQVMIGAGACSTVPRLFNLGRRDELADTIHVSGMLGYAATVISLVTLLVGHSAVSQLFGETADGAQAVLAVLGLGLLLAAWSGPVDSVLIVTGRPWHALGAHVSGVIILLVGVVLLHSTGGGMVGVAMVWGIAWAIARCLNAWFVFSEMRIVSFFCLSDVKLLTSKQESKC